MRDLRGLGLSSDRGLSVVSTIIHSKNVAKKFQLKIEMKTEAILRFDKLTEDAQHSISAEWDHLVTKPQSCACLLCHEK